MRVASSLHPIAVVGAGFSGTMAALHLLPRIGARAILLCERGERFARGVAYGTEEPAHLLNVRAANMSAFPAQPDHFLQWLARAPHIDPTQIHATPAGTFVSRHLYGSYLTGLLTGAVSGPDGGARLILVPDEVVDLVPAGDGYRLVLAGGNEHQVAGAVLAAGNLLPGTERGAYVPNPWVTRFTEGLRDHEPVVVIGSGLTMVDVVLRLHRAGFAGPVIAISRRGLKPHTHAATTPWPTPSLADRERASPAWLLHRLRREARAAEHAGGPWQSVVDSLRPITSDLWRGFPADRQDSFLRHARPWWDIHRHRMAPPVGASIAGLVASGFLTILAGHVVDMTVEDGRADLTVRVRGASETTRIVAQRLVNASGSVAPDQCDNALIGRLLARGLVRPDRHRLGLDQADDLGVIGRSGEPTPRLWALGPLGTGAFWECVAVPDIRQQATRLAQRVAETIAVA